MQNSKKAKNTYQLDASATFYPFIMSKKSQSLFCVRATLDSDVEKDRLESALNDALLRFPSYRTKLKKGYGKYHLVENDNRAKVFPITDNVLLPIDVKKTDGFLFRLCSYGKNVTLTVFHALTDANGAILFLSAILRRYAELGGETFDENCSAWAFDDDIKDGEIEDSFLKYYKPISLASVDLKGLAGGAPHKIEGKYLEDERIFAGCDFAVDDIKARAKKSGVSVTAFLTGLLAYAILGQENVKKPVVLMVPVDLRRVFPSITVQNFVVFVRVIVKKGEFDNFEQCVKECALRLQKAAEKENLSAFISTSVKAQKSFIFRMVPLCVKWFFMRVGRLFLKSRQTFIFSNVGNIALDKALHVTGLEFNVNVSKNNLQNLSLVSYDGVCKLRFTSATDNLQVPCDFVDILEKEGISAKKVNL